MKIETLKTLVLNALNRSDASEEVTAEVLELFSLYETDNSEPATLAPKNWLWHHGGNGMTVVPCATEPDKVPYGSICSCNPANGGSGICGCVMGNQMVPNPKKYPSTTISTTTDKYVYNSNPNTSINEQR